MPGGWGGGGQNPCRSVLPSGFIEAGERGRAVTGSGGKVFYFIYESPWWCVPAPQLRLTGRRPPRSPLPPCSGTPASWRRRGSAQMPPPPPGYGTAGASETVEEPEQGRDQTQVQQTTEFSI